MLAGGIGGRNFQAEGEAQEQIWQNEDTMNSLQNGPRMGMCLDGKDSSVTDILGTVSAWS